MDAVIDVENQTDTDLEVDIPNLWGAKFHNDDFTPMDFVLLMLIQFFKQDEATAMDIMMKVHTDGQYVVGAYTRDVAETKASDATKMARSYGYPLQITPVSL